MPTERIEIVPYDVRWPVEFDALGVKIRGALGELALRINHIGSTSVPGLPAKNVIDVQVAVAALDRETLATRLTAVGLVFREPVDRDHVPPAGPPTEMDWRKLFFRQATPEGRRANIHVRVLGAANQRYAVLFRDYLRASITARDSYAAVKRALAELHPDNIDAYLLVKDPVCDIIIEAAELWAKTVGWETPATDG